MDRRLLLVLAVGVVLVALVLGGLAVVDRVRGGASSPTALAERLTSALDNGDVGALVRLVEPGERSALERLARGWSDRLAALDLPEAVGGGPGGGTGSGGALDGLDLTLTGTTARVESQSGDLAVVGLPDLGVRVRSTPADAHGLLRALYTYRRMTDPQDLGYPADGLPGDLAPRVVAVERQGRWYVSLLATLLGPGVAEGSTPSVAALEPVDAPTPEAAVEATVRATVDALRTGDAVPLARTLDASGADAAQLWGSEVVTTATAEPEHVDALRTTAEPIDGDRAVVRVESLTVSGRARLDVADGCARTGSERACLHPSGYRYADGVASLGVFALLGHDGAFRLTAVRDGAGWRTSLPDSLADALVAYADHLSRAQVLALLRRPTLDRPSGVLRPDVADDVGFTDAGYALLDLRVDRAGLYRVAPSPAGTNRAAVYDGDGQPSIQPFYPNDSVYRLDAGDHRVLVWADDDFAGSLRDGRPYVQRVEIRSVR